MNQTVSVAVVIPVYNHPQRLREVVERCLAIVPQVFIVDDGSDHPVAPVLEGLNVEVLRHEVNQGKGMALRTAAHHLAQQGFQQMITLDADGQHYPEDLPKFLDNIQQHPDQLHLGVRDMEGAEVPGSSRFGRDFGNFWVRLQTGHKVGDIQSGYRAYPIVVLESVSCWCKRYGYEVEVVVRALWAGVTVTSVSVRVLYDPTTKQGSHFHKFYDNVRVSLLNTFLTMRAILPWPHHQLGESTEKVTVWHPLRSIRKLLAEHTTPVALGWAVAVGVFLGAVPLIACHTLAILVVTSFFRLNRLASVAASQICMPPLVPALCIEVGYFMRTGRFLTLEGVHNLPQASFFDLGHMGLQRLWEWFLGSLVVGSVLALLLGGATYLAAALIQRRHCDDQA